MQKNININLTGINFLFLFVIMLFNGCLYNDGSKRVNHRDSTLFRLLSHKQTGIDFTNTLTEGLNTNVLMYEYFYNGGGVAIGDVNGDELQDVYFTGNMTGNKLYLNQGKFKFKDITEVSGVVGRPGPWKTGVTMADVNGDGKLDFYVCYSGKLKEEKRINQLFINQGNDKNGIPVFKDLAADFGLAFPSFSTQAYFFDYDRDGDLDMLLVNHNPKRLSIVDDISVRDLMGKSDSQSGIRLLRNDDMHFRDITAECGIINTSLSYGLAAGVADINGDGWPDIYISNDYSVPDRMYINDGKGKFSDQLQKRIGHTSFYSMGNDIADINNDSKPDIYTLDMLPEDNRRQKLLFGADNYEAFDLNVRAGFYYQYMRNMLHLNLGNNSFSEIGQFAGVSNTDWSWAPLFADYDNDGWKDLFVSNGYTKDYTNMDFLKFIGDNLSDRNVMREDLLSIVSQMPSSKIKSYFFKNNGNTSFTNTSQKWGITESSNSNGAAYADLDNDGDLDMVVNNVNKQAFIYENQALKQNGNYYLSIRLKGLGANTQGIGAKIIIYKDGKTQYIEQMPTRGFQSSVSPVIHFGLGKDKKIDSLEVIWQRDKSQILKNINANQILTLNENEAVNAIIKNKPIKPVFTESQLPIAQYKASGKTNDFKRQPLMVNAISLSVPCLVKGDFNGDGLEDLFTGGSVGQSAKIYLQHASGKFKVLPQRALEEDKQYHDIDALFFDANADGKQDLYISSGGYNNLMPEDPLLQDRLYLNDGTGNLERAKRALPIMLSSSSCVRVADVNSDGSPDLFVGGRVTPGRYPEAPRSYILINNGKGVFKDETGKYNMALKNIGMVTDAVWADMNGDKKPDLIVVGEWMPIAVFANTNGKLVNATSTYFDKNYKGWWNCIRVSDINNDGRADIIAGNMGLNTQCRAFDGKPVEMFYKDFDDNGSVDPILCFYIGDKSYPYVTRDELLDQISSMRTRFPDYKSYADATLGEIFTPEERKDAKHLTANSLKTSCFLSNSSGKLHPVQLPLEVQYSPVFTITQLDYNKDGREDLLLCGNINNARLKFGKYDANYGQLLQGDGKGNFKYINQRKSGFNIKGDVRSVVKFDKFLLFAINESGFKAYNQNN